MHTLTMAERRWIAMALAVGAAAFISAIAASWPWDSRPGDPRWEMIRQRANIAKRELDQRRRDGEPISKPLLDAEVDLEAELATQDDLQAAGRALHAVERAIQTDAKKD